MSPSPRTSASPLPSRGGGNSDDTEVPQSPPRGWQDDPGRLIIEQPTTPLRRATTTRTNIVVVMLDDVAEMDLRLWRRMPAIKRVMLDHGVRFTRYYGNDPFCCPGRANFLTGLFTDHHGVYTNEATLFDPRRTIATELQAVGYHTIISGKYLNGLVRVRDKTPPGWSHVTIDQGSYYRYTLYRDGIPEYHDNDPNDYSTDVFANDVVAAIRDSPASKPIFAYFAPFGIHAGLDEAGRFKAGPVPARRHERDPRCATITPWHPANYEEADVSDKPAYVRARRIPADPATAAGWSLVSACETMLSVDDAFARIVEELRLEGRLADTLFVLTADNGMGFGSHRWPNKEAPYTTQLPLFLSWTQGRGNQPAVNDTWVSNVDLAPTLCAVAGCLMGPYSPTRRSPDGSSFLEQIAGSTRPLARTVLYEEHRVAFGPGGSGPPWRAIRTTSQSPLGLWHYIEYDDGERELYDVSGGQCWEWKPGNPGDPCELTNLAGNPAYASVQAKLAAELASLVDDPAHLP
jgi:N-acetylglucosamine-6-sulfatase